MALPYNPEDKASILEFAKRLQGNSLKNSCDAGILAHNYSGKGNFGQVLEKFYFLYEPNSDAEPDFASVGLELKSSPLKKLRNNEYRSKERLVLNIINYLEVVSQEFETSSFWKKNANLLLIFYLHEADSDFLDYVIKLVDEWSFPSTDLEIIKKDWEKIKQKIADGEAHNLSEGDTFYLGACTKGSRGGNLRPQPNNSTLAKQRAYSLKQGYVNHIIASIANESSEVYGKLITSAAIARTQTIEEIVISKFTVYYDKTVDEILEILALDLNKTDKKFTASLTKAILGIELDKEIEEFKKADIEVKAVRLQQNNLPKESMSFPSFEYVNVATEEWDESCFKQVLEKKFLIVFFQFTSRGLVLRKAKFWNMPQRDIEEAKLVWNATKEVITKGEIVYKVVGKYRYTNFPNKSDNRVAHVRPHTNVVSNTFPLPVRDKYTGVDKYTKHSFWLNNDYIRDEIYLK